MSSDDPSVECKSASDRSEASVERVRVREEEVEENSDDDLFSGSFLKR